jgi:FMN-dependent NADH-azoreductase
MAASTSRRLGRRLLQHAMDKKPDLRVIERDLASQPLPHIDGDYASAMQVAPENRTPPQDQALALSEQLIRELEASDLLIIATPMHNYTVPATLKIWIDHVVRVGRSFQSTPRGKVGLLQDRPTFVAVTSGGAFSGESNYQPDFLTGYLRAVLATIGIHDVEFISVEKLARDAAPVATIERQADAWLLRNTIFP